jgi:hypothetical protein
MEGRWEEVTTGKLFEQVDKEVRWTFLYDFNYFCEENVFIRGKQPFSLPLPCALQNERVPDRMHLLVCPSTCLVSNSTKHPWPYIRLCTVFCGEVLNKPRDTAECAVYQPRDMNPGPPE